MSALNGTAIDNHTRIKRGCLLLLTALSLFATNGCKDREAASGQTRNVSAEEHAALKDLELKAGLCLPTNAVLVSAGDGGGREASHEFYEWAVFSPSAITMPPRHATGASDDLNLRTLDGHLRYVQSRMGKREIEQPQAALGSDWQTNGFGFSGTLIRAPKGDYLVIRRGRIE